MPAWQPAANSLQANAPSEFAVTSHSQSLRATSKNMKRLILFSILYFSYSNLIGQSIEFYGGALINSFYDFERNDNRTVTDYKSGLGYALRISYNAEQLTDFPFRLTLYFEQYSGEIYKKGGGQGGGSIIDINTVKQSIGIGIYPLNFKFGGNFKVNFGANFNLLISEKESGYHSFWLGGTSNETYWDNDSAQLSSTIIFGLSSRFAYKIKVSENWCIVPQYQFYWGLSDEFESNLEKVKSIRNYFLVGILLNLK